MLHAPFIDYDLSVANRVNAAWLNAVGSRVDESISVKESPYLAKGDGTTDDLAAFNAAAAAAFLAKKALYIPPLAPGLYYKLSGAWTLTDLDGLVVYGAGVSSLIVCANASGASGIEVNSSTHVTIKDIGISGTSGTAHGLEIKGASHYGKYERIWIGHFGGAQIKVTSGQSNVFVNCDADVNNGYNPATLLGGLTNGTPQYGVWVDTDVSGNTNNQTFLGCRINACGGTVSLKVGGTGTVQSFAWFGGVIQGSSVAKEIDIEAKDSLISGCHIERIVGATANYTVILRNCVRAVISGGIILGDAEYLSCTGSGIRDFVGDGCAIDSGCSDCFVENGIYGSMATGPLGGTIQDNGTRTRKVGLTNASNDRFHAGNRLPRFSTYMNGDMSGWFDGVPVGFTNPGGALTKEATIIHDGPYSAKIIYSVDNTQGIEITMDANVTAGKDVHTRGFVRYSAGVPRIGGIESGTGAANYIRAAYATNVWRQFSVTFNVQDTATGFKIRYTGDNGTTAYWSDIVVEIEGVVYIIEKTITDSATPAVTYNGLHVPLWLTNGSATVTNFTNAIPGKDFTLLGRAGHAMIISNNANIVNKSGADITMNAGVTATYRYSETAAKFYEI